MWPILLASNSGQVKLNLFRLAGRFLQSKWRTIKSNGDETKQDVSKRNLQAWLWNSEVSPWFHLLILCFHHTLQRDMKWRQAWKELTEGGGSMWWYDHSLLCFGLLCACVCVCVRACMCALECLRVRMCVYVCVLWVKLGSDTHFPRPTPPTSLLLPNRSPRRIPRRPWKVGLHLNKFSSNWPRRITFLNPVCWADCSNMKPCCYLN